MSNLVVVAIPEEQDRVWKVSSEQVPHLTILFLGDEQDADTQQIMQFVEHAVTLSEHGQFYLTVDHRGTLGEDDADVLFFKKNNYDTKWIKQFRSQLLKNDAVKTAYDSTEQYDEWLPHITLGYPESPAKPQKDDDYPIYSVCFDRIAVWAEDYNGPEFRLEWPERELENDLAVAYSDTQKAALMHCTANGISADEHLEHYGKLGMKWGIRRARNAQKEADKFNRMADKAEGKGVGPLKDGAASVYRKQAAKSQAVADKRFAKVDEKWSNNQFTLEKGIERHNAMAEHFNKNIETINSKFPEDFSKEPHEYPEHWSPRYKEYMTEVAKLENTSFRHAVEQVHGTSPSGKMKATVELDADGQTLRMSIKNIEVKHAASETTDEVFLFRVTRNAKGLITNVEPVEDSMAQTEEIGAEFIIEHFGIKGMRWGHRKEQFQAKLHERRVTTEAANREKRPAKDIRAYPTIGSSKRQQSRVDTKGGEDHPPTEDAIKVAVSRQKLRKSGVHALTNAELREVANRLSLEQQVANLETRKVRKSMGRQFVDSIITDKGNQKAAGRFAVKTILKKSAKLGAAAAI